MIAIAAKPRKNSIRKIDSPVFAPRTVFQCQSASRSTSRSTESPDRVLYSVIQTRSLSLAQELYFQIQEGARSFEEIARAHSEGAEAQTGGIVGPVELSTLHPRLATRLLTSQPGEVIPFGRLDQWVLIVRLEQLLP
ncbi:MAG: hypothetical protein HC769_14065 [Cyanobacteria bacterium CRU_2_1]|nr:hypothetical protein [Cyanobacteria bacterium RU_5_0]NJR59858.1 hypothetical protein [Cyanobacteria bacterium CRU_2_1]